jgi:hypothetical protein
MRLDTERSHIWSLLKINHTMGFNPLNSICFIIRVPIIQERIERQPSRTSVTRRIFQIVFELGVIEISPESKIQIEEGHDRAHGTGYRLDILFCNV